MKLSIIIPAYNEAESISETIEHIVKAFEKENIDFDIFVVNDNSKDNTVEILEELQKKYSCVKYQTNEGPNGLDMQLDMGSIGFQGIA